VTLDAAIERVLARLSDGQVEALAAASAARSGPGSTLPQLVAGAQPGSHSAVTGLSSAWAATPGLTGAGVALALRVGLRARRTSETHRSRPVWTGPGATGEQHLTAAVLHELVAGATERVVILSYAAFTLSALASDLENAVRRGCTVDVVFENEADSGGGYQGQGTPFENVEGIARWRWPADRRGTGAALHAKVLVVDGRRALVGSANLTNRALTANLEAGVLVADPQVAEAIEEHVRELMAAGELVQA
jgi:phosphatidylserine/phosphatidylglycerophosphate/cardiolipin synthase-like enzyme